MRTAKTDPSPRPESRADEDAAVLQAYRGELERVADILGLRGSPDLTADLAPAVLRLKKALLNIQTEVHGCVI